MSHLLLLLALAAPPTAPLPEEVAAFVEERDACDHFRGEPAEGDSPEDIERRAFVRESYEIYCAGTDRKLAALRRRYRDNEAVMAALSTYEPDVEGPPCTP